MLKLLLQWPVSLPLSSPLAIKSCNRFLSLFTDSSSSSSSALSRRRRPSGGAVDIIVVQQRDGSFKCSPWYVRFGKLQGARKLRRVAVSVNDVQANFGMLLNRRGDVFFLKDSDQTSLEQQQESLEKQQESLDQQDRAEREAVSYGRRWYVKHKLQKLVPSSEELASLRLKQGRNSITFKFAARIFGEKQIDAGIYLFKWNDKLVISDVDGTITRSDILGQFMPLVGRDWSQTGVARLFSAIKDNGYHLVFLTARAISQAHYTRAFLKNVVQDGEKLPDGPVVTSSDGIFPCIYREVVQRTPHEFKIQCLKDIRSLFPLDVNPFYAGFGNRDTDVASYLEAGIGQDKVFTINPKGELVAKNAVNVLMCYTSLHKLVHEQFPPIP